MILIRKDEVKFLRQNGMEKFIIGRTRNGKKYVEESRRVLEALKKYNASILMEDKKL